MNMDVFSDMDRVSGWLATILHWVSANLLSVDAAIEAGFALTALSVALLVCRIARPGFDHLAEEARKRSELLHAVVRPLCALTGPLIFALLCRTGELGMVSLDRSVVLLNVFYRLATAWAIVRLLSGLMPNRFWARVFSAVIWTGAALHIVGLYDDLINSLDAVSMSVGDSRISLLLVIKGVLLAVVLLQSASIASRFFEQRMRGAGLSPSLQVLSVKAVRFSLFAAALLMAVSSMGIDLTSLAVLSGAVGVGIGFGLQKIFSNLVSGIILLMDRSIKPGDTIEIGEVYGTIRSLQARYASVLTRDGKEYLIPNEHLITNQVINWTYSDSNVRLKIPVGIAYESDVRLAMQLMEKAATSVTRVLKNPAPAARLVGFGDSSVDLQVRIWIRDSDKGVVNVQSEVLLNIWDAFHENGIEFPFPQQDVFIKPGSSFKLDK